MTRGRLKSHVLPTLLGALWLTQPAATQEALYSADSLVAAFKQGASLKGAEVTVTDVIAEIKKSQVTFKSSENDKVICELDSPIDGGNNKEYLIGASLTVVGRIKGRGLLGNVTINQCHVATSDAVTKLQTIETSLEQTAQVRANSEEQPTQSSEQSAATSVHAAAPVVTNPVLVNRPIPPTTQNRLLAKGESPNSIPPCNPVPNGSEVLKTDSGETPGITLHISPRIFQASLVLLVGISAFLAFKKLRSAPRISVRNSSPEEVRRAALEALLAQKKKY